MGEIEKDHPLQAIDTEVPDGEYVNEAAWESMRAELDADEEDSDE